MGHWELDRSAAIQPGTLGYGNCNDVDGDEIMKPYQLFRVQWSGSMDMSTMSSIYMFSMYFVICLGRGEGGGSSLSLLGGVTRPDFCSWPSRLFQAFQPEHFSRHNLLPGKGVQQVTVPYFSWWCYKLQIVRTASTRVCHWEEEGFVQ